jgi:acetyltransferase-like isoleucine patch superfamily enzyme
MLHLLLERIIRNLKHDPGYKLDAALDNRALFQVLHYRGAALLRGMWYSLWLCKTSGPLFVGSHTKLRHPQLISVGRSTIIEDYVTIDALSCEGVRFDDNVTIAKFTTIQCTGVIRSLGKGLVIGSNSAVGAYSFLGAQGGIRIGSNVIMGPRVNFHSENHIYQDLNIPIRLQGEARQGILVEDDCWIGAGTVVLDGVRIERGCVVAAGSVVAQDLPAYSVAAGVPARIVKTRRSSVKNQGELL